MNNFEAHLMVSARGADSKVLGHVVLELLVKNMQNIIKISF